jgi:enoyl-CoA hydratase
MYSGATFAPDAALARGLVDELTDADGLLERASAAAETLAALSPPAFAQTKQQVRQPAADAMARHGERVAASAVQIWTAPATLARIKDYVDKTLRKS